MDTDAAGCTNLYIHTLYWVAKRPHPPPPKYARSRILSLIFNTEFRVFWIPPLLLLFLLLRRWPRECEGLLLRDLVCSGRGMSLQRPAGGLQSSGQLAVASESGTNWGVLHQGILFHGFLAPKWPSSTQSPYWRIDVSNILSLSLSAPFSQRL